MVWGLLAWGLAPVLWAEAEACPTVCAVRQQPGDSQFASGGRIAPNYWGQTVGDAVTWEVRRDASLDTPWLAVRYAYDKAQFGKNPASPRLLEIRLDGRRVGDVHVPDTGSWNQFQVAWLRLPTVPPGQHTLAVVTTAAETNTDLDCLGLFHFKPDPPQAPFVETVVAKSPDGRFVLRRTANAPAPEPTRVFREFNRIYDTMLQSTGLAPGLPVGINSVEDARWPNAGWSAYSNGFGTYYHSGIMPNDVGNWCHEMTHLMFQGRCPPWLEEPFVRVITANVWIDRLYSVPSDVQAHRRGLQAAGRDFRENPGKKFDSVEPVLNALADKYGPDVLVRFLRECSEAGKRKELDFDVNRKLTTAEVVKYLSKAAGEDVTPWLARWSGFGAVRGQ